MGRRAPAEQGPRAERGRRGPSERDAPRFSRRRTLWGQTPWSCDFDSVGSFKISDLVFGKLQDATCRSYLSNFTGIPTDCPHREKNGWTGDAQLAMETGLWNFDAKAGYVHFMRMMIDALKESGAVSVINPASAGWGYGSAPWPAWDAALFEIPWQIYRFYGDDAPAREAYPAMKKYFSFVGGKAREGGKDQGVFQQGVLQGHSNKTKETKNEHA